MYISIMQGLEFIEPMELYNLLQQGTNYSRLSDTNYLFLIGKHNFLLTMQSNFIIFYYQMYMLVLLQMMHESTVKKKKKRFDNIFIRMIRNKAFS